MSLAEQESISCVAQVREARRLLGEGDTAGALSILEPLTSDETVYLPARLTLAMTAWRMGQLDWALDLTRQCHEIWPMEGTVAEVLASLYAQAGDLGESLFMGKLATALGGLSELAEFVVPDFPTFDSAFYNIKDRPKLAAAKASLSSGKLANALEQARQHSALNPTDGHAHAFYASMLLGAGEASTAAGVLGAVGANTELPPYCAGLYARALTAVGDFAGAKNWHARALQAAPEDDGLAAARIKDGLWLGDDASALAKAGADWVSRFCLPAKHREWRCPKDKLVIGYLVPEFADPLDVAAIAAAARAHDRERVTVIGYGNGSQSWESNVPFQGAFDVWQDIRGLDPATLVRFFERGGLHVVIDAAGFAAPTCLKALARLQTAIRVAWLGNTPGIGKPIYDAQIVGLSATASAPEAWRISPAYPIVHLVERERPKRHGRHIHFGADVSMAQLDEHTVALWSAVLEAQPTAKLLLRARDMGPGHNLDRLIARFGNRLAARIDLIADEPTEGFYALVDIALTPIRAASPRMAAEALACGVPAVALDRGDGRSEYGGFLRDLGLAGMLVAADKEEYVNIALKLAGSAKDLQEAVRALKKALPPGDESARRFARAIETQALDALKAVEDAAE